MYLVEQEIVTQQAHDNTQLNKMCYKMGTLAPICHLSLSIDRAWGKGTWLLKCDADRVS